MEIHEQSAELQAMGCSAIDNLMGGQPGEPITAKMPDQGLAVVFKALKKHSDDAAVVRRGASAIATIAQQNPPAPQLVGNSDVVDLLGQAGKYVLSGKQDAQALVQIFRALEALAEYKENHRFIVADPGAFTLALSLVQTQSPRPAPVARALAVIAKVCESEDVGKTGGTEVPEADGLTLVTKSLGHYWNHPSVVIPACTIMAALAKSSSQAGKSSDGDSWRQAMCGLIKAVKARPADVAVAVSACVALAWTCERKVKPNGVLVGDMMAAFVMVMRAHPRDADVAEAACFMFSAVVKAGGDEVRGQVIRSGAPLLVVMVLRHFSEEQGDVQPVLRRAVNAIRLVGLEDPATAGAVKLAGAPDALKKILSRFPESQGLVKATNAALEAIEKEPAGQNT
eukprot:CAMPEP_0184309480 /NCGR_PEP_ID=MMETSP1049-20130417/17631_1 /TAXON_ID=77928 /ORGANISM="Proteomonas sulcata, Strain CCMP704" /LENGTH=396 /DNA_ID=CAMNT_0026622363 /DNA_START=1 /DNA_END=1191 /DNA_ORIENTATION=+